MNHMHNVLHGVAIKKHAKVADIAHFLDISEPDTVALLRIAASAGRVVEDRGKYVLSPLARVALEASYSRYYSALRANAELVEAADTFERINAELKALITAWQTISTGGRTVLNDHSDSDYDMRIIDRLGAFHERADVLLLTFERILPRYRYYRSHLLAALESAENGRIGWVSDAKLASYHTVWFELHEDLLRILGRRRRES